MVAGPPVTVSDFVANGILGVLMMLPKIAVGWHEDEASSAITSKRDLPAFSVGTDGNRHRTGHLAWSANLVELINWQTLRHQYAFIGLVVLGRRQPSPYPMTFCWISDGSVPVFDAVFNLAFILRFPVGRYFDWTLTRNARSFLAALRPSTF